MANWSGTVSFTNIDSVCAMIEKVLEGNIFSFTDNEGSRDGTRLEPRSSTDRRSVWVARGLSDPCLYVNITSTTLPIRLGDAVEIKGDRITINLASQAGLKRKWVLSVA